eukprot:g24610.t1
MIPRRGDQDIMDDDSGAISDSCSSSDSSSTLSDDYLHAMSAKKLRRARREAKERMLGRRVVARVKDLKLRICWSWGGGDACQLLLDSRNGQGCLAMTSNDLSRGRKAVGSGLGVQVSTSHGRFGPRSSALIKKRNRAVVLHLGR